MVDTPRTINIADQVLLAAKDDEIAYLKNRSLVLGQLLQDASDQLNAARDEIYELQAKAAGETADASGDMPTPASAPLN